MIRVRVIAPSPALLAGLRSMLAADAAISVVQETGVEAGPAPSSEDIDVTVVAQTAPGTNLAFPDAGRLATPVLFLRSEPVDVRTLAAYASACGVLPLDSSAAELQAAVHALAAGLLVAAPSLAAASGESIPAGGPLTDRETEVLTLLSKGLANKQIAVALGISEHTVKFHVSSIYTKLNATNRTQAVREGLRSGWIAL